MDQNTISRKEFIVLTFTLAGSAAAAGSCSDSGGSSTGAGGSGGGGGQVTCDNPLAAAQTSDSTGHTHTLTVAASVLQATTPQMFTTSSSGAHTHTVTLSPTQLTTVRNGGSVTVTSSSDNGHSHAYEIACQA
jgi:hypothetical protein